MRKKIILIMSKDGKKFGYGLSIPFNMDEDEVVKEISEGYEIVHYSVS